MKKLTLLAFFCCTCFMVSAKDADTAYYRRPYYLGVSYGYNGFINGVFQRPASIYSAYLDPESHRALWSSSYGVQLAFPFGKRWELELALEGMYTEGWDVEVTDIHIDPDNQYQETGRDLAIEHARSNSLVTRIQIGYELYRKNNYALTAGAEFWTDVLGRQPLTGYNDLGLAFVLKSYIPVSNANGAVQISGVAGNIGTGAMYVGMRLGFALKGTRVYRHKPRNYYVRTYED